MYSDCLSRLLWKVAESTMRQRRDEICQRTLFVDKSRQRGLSEGRHYVPVPPLGNVLKCPTSLPKTTFIRGSVYN